MKIKFQIILMFLLGICISKASATNITFECRDGQPNALQDSITYEYNASIGYFSPDFTIYQVNTNPNSTNEQYYKENKLGWRLSNGQALHFYGKSNVTAITQIDILCADADYVDTNINTSAGTIEFIGDKIIRIVIPPGQNITELQIYKDVGSPQLRPVEITMNYLVDGEIFTNPAPLGTKFVPIPETYYRPWEVTISTLEPGATIHYTTDGSIPTSNSAIYTDPVYIDSDTEINSIAFKNGVASAIETGAYNIRELPDVLEPNSNYLIDFADLTETAQETPVILQISTPTNFDPAKEHPIFVWFGGGSGGYSNGIPKNIIQNEDFITIGLPYQSWDAPSGGGWQTPWSYHKIMLDSIENLIPNIDPERRIVGGFSSGGAMIAWHINNSNLEFQQYFSAFLPSGATAISSMPNNVYNSLNDLPMLVTIGENDPRLPFVIIYYEIAAGINPDQSIKNTRVEFNLLEGIGHAIPVPVRPFIRDWIYQNVMEGSCFVGTTEVVDEATTVVEVTINAVANTLEVNDLKDYEGVTIFISNSQGQILQTHKVLSDNSSIPLDHSVQPNALYIISGAKNGKIVFNKKFVIIPH